MKKQYILGLFFLCGGLFACSPDTVSQANFEVIPLPQDIQASTTGDFTLTDNTVIVYPK